MMMKTAMSAFVLLLVLAIPLSFANGKHSEMMSHENMMGDTTHNLNGPMMGLKDNQVWMNEMMEEIYKTKDINERHELMQELMTTMQEMMGKMQSMMTDK
jgi:hypothetical protein